MGPSTPSGEEEAKNQDDDSSPAGAPPRKKMNAALQFRSRRKRISHPLLDPAASSSSSSSSSHTPSAGPKGWGFPASYTTPPRASHHVVTPEPNRSPESSTLVDALKMAARPNNDVAVQPSSTYSSSIEAMAAHVEASHTKKRSTTKSKTPTKITTRHSRSDSSISSMGNRKSSASSKASRTSGRKDSHPSSSPQRTMWLLAISVLLSFMACESFLWLLVLRFKDSVEVVMGAKKDVFQEETLSEKKVPAKEGIIDVESESVPVFDDSDSPIVDYFKSVEDYGDIDEVDSRDEMDIKPYEELTRLQSALEEGFANLRHSGVESRGKSNRQTVDSLCGDVWVAANEMLYSKYLNNSAVSSSIIKLIGPSEMRFDESQESEFNSLRSMALDAQHCLGGSGMAFLSADSLDYARLRVTTKVFDELSKVEPYNPDVKAGLGTSLLIQGIFYQEIREGVDDNVQSTLFSLAAHHLKLASLLCSSTPKGAAGSGSDAPNAMSRLAKVNDKNAASHAAILHNLALSYVALGDSASSVPILLRAAAMGRDGLFSTKPYWNVPNDVLQAAEEKVLLIAVTKRSRGTKRRSRRVPFVSFLREDDKVEGR